MFKTEKEAIELAKEYMESSGHIVSDIHVWAGDLINQGGHRESDKCVCKPRVEVDDGIKIIHHNLLVH